MKKYLVSIIIMMSAAVNAQSISFGTGFSDGNHPMYGTATIGLPIEYKIVKIDPYVSWTTFPMQRLEKYQNPYFMDNWSTGVNVEIGNAYFKYSRTFSTRSYQQRHYDYGSRHQYFQPNKEDANVVEVGWKFTFNTIKID